MQHRRGRVVDDLQLERPREGRGGDVETQALERNAASQVDAPDGSRAAIQPVGVALFAFGGERHHLAPHLDRTPDAQSGDLGRRRESTCGSRLTRTRR